MNQNLLHEIEGVIINSHLRDDLTSILTSPSLNNFLELSSGNGRFSRFIESELEKIIAANVEPHRKEVAVIQSFNDTLPNAVMPPPMHQDLVDRIEAMFPHHRCRVENLVNVRNLRNGRLTFQVLKLGNQQRSLLGNLMKELLTTAEDFVLLPIDHSIRTMYSATASLRHSFQIQAGPSGCIARFLLLPVPSGHINRVRIEFTTIFPPAQVDNTNLERVFVLPPDSKHTARTTGEGEPRLTVLITGNSSTITKIL
jgi:hypothetical protein